MTIVVAVGGTLLSHWLEYNFAPPHEVWYHGAAWGNVAALLPLAIVTAAVFIYHHYLLTKLRKSHDEHLRIIADALDPTTDTDTQLDVIHALVDEKLPGGVKVVLDLIEERLPPDDETHVTPSE